MSKTNLTYSNLIAIFGLAILFISACNTPRSGDEIKRLARVGNEYLTLDHARNKIPDFTLQEDSIGALRTYRETWIENRLMLQEAERLQLRQNSEVQNKIQQAQQEVLTQALKEAVISDYEEELVVTDE